MIESFFSWLFKLIFGLVANAIDVVIGIMGLGRFPEFASFQNYIINFWDLCFQGIGYIRSAFLIGDFEMSLIVEMLTIRLTYKPVIAIVKMFIHWFEKLKIG